MLPTLQFAADKNEHSFRETIEYLANKYDLTEEERKERVPCVSLVLREVNSHTMMKQGRTYEKTSVRFP